MSDTPGSVALENLKKQEQEVAEFKKPTIGVRRKKGRPKILTEEQYVEELGKIIQRDFFPDLEKLRAQNEYLEAMERKDYTRMQELRAKYSSTAQYTGGSRRPMTNMSMSPATFDTPSSNSGNATVGADDGSDTPKSCISNVSRLSSSNSVQTTLADKHTLDSFLQNYTSEDNESFEEIIEAADERLRQKFAVLYGEERMSADKLKRALMLPDIVTQFQEADAQRKIETWNYTNKNSIMYIPEGVELTEAERVEMINKRQIIKHDNTRLSENPFNEAQNRQQVSDIAKSQAQAANDRIGVDGLAVANNATHTQMPQIRGFSLVKTPSPRPGECFSPLMTWGEIEGTPFRLDGSDTPLRADGGPSFRINETSRRENIALALAEKVGEKMRAQKQRAMNTARKNIKSPLIRSNVDRLASISPAARRLATTKLGVRTPMLTPTPGFTPRMHIKQTHQMVGTKTGASEKIAGKGAVKSSRASSETSGIYSAPSTPKQISSGRSTLTDDLLRIPNKRLRAADFF